MFFQLDKNEAFKRVEAYVEPLLADATDCYYSLGGIKTVRIRVCDPAALQLMERHLVWVKTAPVVDPDATIVLWKESSVNDFISKCMKIKEEDNDTWSGFYGREEFIDYSRNLQGVKIAMSPYLAVDKARGTVYAQNGSSYYHAVESFEPHIWGKDGHLFAKLFYRILDTPTSNLVHGACVGLGGNGMLFTARAMKGKSTLTVTSLLRGFEYVSDDYFIIEKSEGGLLASPIYSIVNLSPKMYNTLYDELERARFVAPSAVQWKYTLDISRYEDSLRRRYPIRLAMIPEIDLDAKEPRIDPCTSVQRGGGIAQLIHSTVSQIYDRTPQKVVQKLSMMLSSLPFYKITLCPDIFANVECLREFAKNLNN